MEVQPLTRDAFEDLCRCVQLWGIHQRLITQGNNAWNFKYKIANVTGMVSNFRLTEPGCWSIDVTSNDYHTMKLWCLECHSEFRSKQLICIEAAREYHIPLKITYATCGHELVVLAVE